jgi:hypothetical protein
MRDEGRKEIPDEALPRAVGPSLILLGMWNEGYKEIPDEALPCTLGPSLIPRPSTPLSLILQEEVLSPNDKAHV